MSNIFKEQERKVLKEEEYRRRRFREIWNLLGKLSPQNGLMLIDKDNFLDVKTKDFLVKQIMRKLNSEQLMEVEAPGRDHSKSKNLLILAEKNAYAYRYLESIRNIQTLPE